jgi:hypothetical protein
MKIVPPRSSTCATSAPQESASTDAKTAEAKTQIVGEPESKLIDAACLVGGHQMNSWLTVPL